MRTGRPRAATRALRIVATPYNGWLWADQWYTDAEWKQAEKRRRYDRVRRQPARLTEQEERG